MGRECDLISNGVDALNGKLKIFWDRELAMDFDVAGCESRVGIVV